MWRDDLRDSLRSLRQDLRGTLLAVSLLAVTIGAITAIYAIVHAVVLRPFTFVDQDRLAMIWQRDDRRALPVIEVAYGNMTDWLARSRSLQSLGLISSVNWSLTLGGGAEPESVPMAGVSASFFPVVGTLPERGRVLLASDEQGTRPAVMRSLPPRCFFGCSSSRPVTAGPDWRQSAGSSLIRPRAQATFRPDQPQGRTALPCSLR